MNPTTDIQVKKPTAAERGVIHYWSSSNDGQTYGASSSEVRRDGGSIRCDVTSWDSEDMKSYSFNLDFSMEAFAAALNDLKNPKDCVSIKCEMGTLEMTIDEDEMVELRGSGFVSVNHTLSSPIARIPLAKLQAGSLQFNALPALEYIESSSREFMDDACLRGLLQGISSEDADRFLKILEGVEARAVSKLLDEHDEKGKLSCVYQIVKEFIHDNSGTETSTQTAGVVSQQVNYQKLVGRVVQVEQNGILGIWHGDDLDRCPVNSTHVGELLEFSDKALKIRDYKTGSVVEIPFPSQQGPNDPGNITGDWSEVTMSVSLASCESFACAAPGKYRVLNWDKSRREYTLVAAEGGFDFADYDGAKYRADSLEGLMSQGFVTDDTGKIVYHGPTRSDLDQ